MGLINDDEGRLSSEPAAVILTDLLGQLRVGCDDNAGFPTGVLTEIVDSPKPMDIQTTIVPKSQPQRLKCFKCLLTKLIRLSYPKYCRVDLVGFDHFNNGLGGRSCLACAGGKVEHSSAPGGHQGLDLGDKFTLIVMERFHFGGAWNGDTWLTWLAWLAGKFHSESEIQYKASCRRASAPPIRRLKSDDRELIRQLLQSRFAENAAEELGNFQGTIRTGFADEINEPHGQHSLHYSHRNQRTELGWNVVGFPATPSATFGFDAQRRLENAFLNPFVQVKVRGANEPPKDVWV